MERRIRREFRALLAPWLLALLLATTALWWRPGTDENAAVVLWLACFALGMVLLAVAAFGKEFSHDTLRALLSQPISRSRLWLEKAGALALAMVGVFLALTSLFTIPWARLTRFPATSSTRSPALDSS